MALLQALLLLIPVAGASGGPLDEPFTSENIEVIRTLRGASGSGMRVVGRHLYVSSSASLTIYDISDPSDPKKFSQLRVPDHDDDWLSEDLETNGDIALVLSKGALFVVDVTDKRHPKVVGSVEGRNLHTVECVLRCTYAYADNGWIVDLRRPAYPKIVGNWARRHQVISDHAVTEVQPGMLLTASQPMYLLDARKDPTKPKALMAVEAEDFVHQVSWPARGSARFAVTGGESGDVVCSTSSAALRTWDTSGWRRTRGFQPVAEWRPPAGSPTDGAGVASTLCGHWFDHHPDYNDGGLIAASWYAYGTHVVRVGTDGEIERVGWYTPPIGNSYTTAWGSPTILYVADSYAGLQVLRLIDD